MDKRRTKGKKKENKKQEGWWKDAGKMSTTDKRFSKKTEEEGEKNKCLRECVYLKFTHGKGMLGCD